MAWLSQPILRFAPSPNGRLHLGHAYSALFTRRWAERMGGIFLLRIEDIDTARCKPEFTEAIFKDLNWLGLHWPEPAWRQSTRFDAYRSAADDLRKRNLLYPCFCTRAEIAGAAARTDPDGAPFYPGTCRNIGAAEATRRMGAGEPVQWRLNMDAATELAGPLAISEMHPDNGAIGERPADPARWGDVVLVRKDTPTSYHLSVVIDDSAQAISHVTRGRDLYAATDVHRLLQALFGLHSPVYCHHDLIADEDAAKLSKSRGSPTLADMREAGWTADAVRARLGFGPPS
ncbi:MAG TPA: tRNA glutamyl-Q(34) synthetase GluQRS [Devosiaceae bacterium]